MGGFRPPAGSPGRRLRGFREAFGKDAPAFTTVTIFKTLVSERPGKAAGRLERPQAGPWKPWRLRFLGGSERPISQNQFEGCSSPEGLGYLILRAT